LLIRLDQNVPESTLLQTIEQLNNDESVDGI
jgi:5,10-methylene-tetrahydrofolate dehydrogenase/methenyl tetrahydrofolate cyclohydrolase